MKPFAKIRKTPQSAKYLLLAAAFFIALPTLMTKTFPSHAGKLLIASSHMQGGHFERSVLFLTQHNGFTSTAFILNKQIVAIEDLVKIKAQYPFAKTIYSGGPVGYRSEFFFLIPKNTLNAFEHSKHYHRIKKNVQSNHGIGVFRAKELQQNNLSLYNEIVRNLNKSQNIYFVTGYSGWSIMQLNREIFQGYWFVIEAPAEVEFSANTSKIWSKAQKLIKPAKNITKDAI